MQLRNPEANYSLHELLVVNDDLFNQVTPEDEAEIAKYCYEHLQEFNQVIEFINKAYYNADIYQELAPYENDLLEDASNLENILKISRIVQFTEINISLLEVAVSATTNEARFSNHHDFYKHPLKKIKNISNTMNVYLQSLKNCAQELEGLIHTVGMPKLQNRLVFCMNLLLNHPFTSNYASNDKEKIYPLIASKLAEFWYNEGLQLSGVNILNSKELIRSYDIIIKNMRVLLFTFMSGLAQYHNLEKYCYLYILEYMFQIKFAANEFDLEQFAKTHPQVFIKLYDFLFHTEHIFSEEIHRLLEADHCHVKLKHALFELYLSSAYKTLFPNPTNLQSKKIVMLVDSAKDRLLFCLQQKMPDASIILPKYFNEIEINIELAIFYFEQKNPVALPLSEAIYKKIDPIFYDKLLPLTEFWITEARNKLRKFAHKLVANYVNLHHNTAINIVKKLAYRDIRCAHLYMSVLIEEKSPHSFELALPLMENHLNDRHICYQLYCLAELTDKMAGLELLFSAFCKNHPQARYVFLLLLKDESLKDNIQSFLYFMFDKDPENVLTVLKEHSSNLLSQLYVANYLLKKGKFLANNLHTLCEFIAQKSDDFSDDEKTHLVAFYKNVLIHSVDLAGKNFAVKELKKLAPDQLICEAVFDALYCYAKYNFGCAIELANVYLRHHKASEEKFTFLQNIFIIYHADNHSAKKNYYLYDIEKYTYNVYRLHLLAASALEENKKAIIEASFLINTNDSFGNGKVFWDNNEITHAYAITLCIDFLVNIMSEKKSIQYLVNETLMLYHLTKNDYVHAKKYIEICFEINTLHAAAILTRHRLLYKFVSQFSQVLIAKIGDIEGDKFHVKKFLAKKDEPAHKPNTVTAAKINFFNSIENNLVTQQEILLENKKKLREDLLNESLDFSIKCALSEEINQAINLEKLEQIRKQIFNTAPRMGRR